MQSTPSLLLKKRTLSVSMTTRNQNKSQTTVNILCRSGNRLAKEKWFHSNRMRNEMTGMQEDFEADSRCRGTFTYGKHTTQTKNIRTCEATNTPQNEPFAILRGRRTASRSGVFLSSIHKYFSNFFT